MTYERGPQTWGWSERGLASGRLGLLTCCYGAAPGWLGLGSASIPAKPQARSRWPLALGSRNADVCARGSALWPLTLHLTLLVAVQSSAAKLSGSHTPLTSPAFQAKWCGCSQRQEGSVHACRLLTIL